MAVKDVVLDGGYDGESVWRVLFPEIFPVVVVDDGIFQSRFGVLYSLRSRFFGVFNGFFGVQSRW